MTGPQAPVQGRMRASLRSTAVVLALGAVSWAWSEVGFWARFREGDGAPQWVLTWLLYSVVAGLALRVARRFPSGGPAALVLVGSLYGWLVEGALASTVYGGVPFTLVWTGVAWHGLLTVALGWWLLPTVLRSGGRRAVLLCAAVGAAWGVWSAGWWAAVPDDGQAAATPSPVSYAAFVVVVWAAAAAGYLVLHRLPLSERDLRSRWGTGLSVLLLGVWAGFTVVPNVPWAPVGLALLLVLAWVAQRRLAARDDDERPPSAGSWPVGVPPRGLVPSALVPVTALVVYAALSPFAAAPGEGPLVAAIPVGIGVLSLAGALALVWSLWRAWRRTRLGEPPVLDAA